LHILYFMKKSIFSIIIILSFSFCFHSCEIINPAEEIPSYIKIDTFLFTNNPNILEQGGLSSQITDVWVYVDNQPVGAYELPACFPVLNSGEHEILFLPGIKISGISNARGAYPFYTSARFNTTLYPDSIIDLSSKALTKYHDEVIFAFIEDFEDAGIVFEKGPNSDTSIYRTSEAGDVFEGSYSGIIRLDNDRPNALLTTTAAYPLPKGYKPVFMELNYKTNHEFIVGLYANSYANIISQDILIINKTDKWKKIYINLTQTVSRYATANDYTLYLRAVKLDEVAEPKILVDNVKVLYTSN